MNWNNLKNFKCPDCSSTLENKTDFYKCPSCTFRIGEVKFAEIVNKQFPKKLYEPRESNLEDLNNL